MGPVCVWSGTITQIEVQDAACRWRPLLLQTASRLRMERFWAVQGAASRSGSRMGG